MEGISIMKLLVVVALVVLLFGTNKLRRLGSDLGEAIKGFKKSMSDEPGDKTTTAEKSLPEQQTTSHTATTKASTEEVEQAEQKDKQL